jgi:hypothetical protein
MLPTQRNLFCIVHHFSSNPSRNKKRPRNTVLIKTSETNAFT